jgi:hypothetical protein
MAKQVETYKYKIVIKYIDNIDTFVEESTIEPSTINFRLNNEHIDFISVGNKSFNKKDIIYIEELKGE